MALQINYTDTKDGVHSTAYIKVTSADLYCGAAAGGAQNCSATIHVGIWHAQSSRNTPKDTVDQFIYVISGSDYDTYFAVAVLDAANSNPLKKAYQYLKAHVPVASEPDFRTATDV